MVIIESLDFTIVMKCKIKYVSVGDTLYKNGLLKIIKIEVLKEKNVLSANNVNETLILEYDNPNVVEIDFVKYSIPIILLIVLFFFIGKYYKCTKY